MISWIKQGLRAISPYYFGLGLLIIGIIAITAIVSITLYFIKRDQKRIVELEKERYFYQEVSKKCSDIFMLIRKSDLYVDYISGDLLRVFGLNKEELIQDIEAIKRCIPRSAIINFDESFKNWSREEQLELDFPYHKENEKKEYWGHMTLFLSKNQDYYVLFLRDISTQQQWKEQMQLELEQAYQESESKTSFLSQMSHEIRTPMNGILGMITLALMHTETTGEIAGYLSKAQSLSQFLLTLINDILDMSRIESGKIELEQAKFDLFEMSDKLRVMFEQNIEEKGIHFILEMQDFDIRYVIGDELRLTQVVINFLSNSQKFTPTGGSITVTFRQMNKIEDKLHLMIRVRDTGKGIEPEFLARIFKPFEQENATVTRKYGGSGLGMAISDNLIRLMGGEIIIDSELGKGSDFSIYVTLPIATGDQKLPEKTEDTIEDSNLPDEEFDMEGLSILMAEDNEINAEIAVTMLEMLGVTVTVAVDGEDVVNKFAQSELKAYDVILMDIQMPKFDGWEATKKIRAMDREDAKKVPIFALSANAFIEDKRRSTKAGMNGHITKPIDFELLANTIGEELKKRK